MKVIRPVIVTGAVLAASSVAEDDHPEWAAGTTYALGDRVIKAATHRVYESVIADNLDHDPQSELEAAWLDAGPTNRWAMFDSAGGPRTIDDAQISVELVPTAPVMSLGMLDVSAAQVRVQVIAGGATVFDQIDAAPASNLTWLDLPAVAGQRIVVTTTPPAGGDASIGKLVIGDAFDVGETQDGPTASIIDFSRRETDDFGVTSVVERAWARRIAVGSRLSSDDVDAVQRYLASIRAVPVMWIGEPGFEALTVFGYFKEFSVDLQIGTTSNCSLTIEGLPSAQVPVVMPDPAVEGTSDLLVIPPVALTSAMLAASSVPENDAPVWQAASTYQAGDKVIWAETHRVYESLVPGNIGRLPSDVAAWLDLGPTNRWAMFDQALGTATEQATSIEVTIAAVSRVQGLAVLDTNAASVRVRVGAYDRTLPVEGQGGMAVFLDLDVAPGGSITVTIAAQAVGQLASVGTLLFGPLVPLGVTENTPKIGITDFSVKTTDDFGNTNAVERAWAKRMDVRSLVRTDAVDPLTRTMATLRAKPALWIGHDAFESLSVYGFFKDFTSTLSERTSACSFTIEGLSKADKVVPVDDAIVLVTVYRNAAVKPAAPAFDTGQVPAGWTAAPQDLGEGEYRWSVQAEFRGAAQRTAWTTPVMIAGVSWADVIDDDPENPKPEPGATVGATEDERDRLDKLETAPSVYLSNNTFLIPSYSNGAVIDYSGANGQLVATKPDGSNVTDAFTLAVKSKPAALLVYIEGRTYSVTGGMDASEDTATLTLRATGSGAYAGQVYDLPITLTKAKGGTQIVEGLPTTNLFFGRKVFLESDEKTYVYVSDDGTGNPGWTAAVKAEDIEGTIAAAQIDSEITDKVQEYGNDIEDLTTNYGSLANRTSTIEATSAGGSNLFANPEFVGRGLDGWSWWYGAGSTGAAGVDQSDAWRLTYTHTAFLSQSVAGVNESGFYQQISVEAGKWYCISGYLGSHRCQTRPRIEWYDVNGVRLDPVTYGTASTGKSGGKLLSNYDRLFAIGQAPVGAAFANGVFAKSATQSGATPDSYMFLAQPMFGEVRSTQTQPPPYAPGGKSNSEQLTARVTTTEGAVANAEQSIASITLRVEANEASVETQQGAINVLNGKTEAWWQTTLNAGGQSAVIAARSGSGGSIVTMAANKIVLANTAGTQYLDALVIENGNATLAGTLRSDAVESRHIKSKQVTTSHLLVTPESLIPDPYFADEAWWSGNRRDASGWYFEPNLANGNGAAAMGVPKIIALGPQSSRKHCWSSPIPFSGQNQTLRLRAIGTNGTNDRINVVVRFKGAAGADLGDLAITWPAGIGANVLRTAQMAVPGGTVAFEVIVYNESGVAGNGYMWVSGIKLDIAASAELIVDGSITGIKVAARTITADNMAVGTITTDILGAGSVTAAKIAVTTLSAITANIGTITAGMVRNASDSYRIDATNGREIIKFGGFMSVRGAPFGSSSQFLEWYGPEQANLANCTEDNSIRHFKTNGDLYTGGRLSAGVLKNAAQSTSIAANASVSVGPSGSNGGIINVVLSYSCRSTRTDNYAAGSANRTAWTNACNNWGATIISGDYVDQTKSVSCNVVINLARGVNGGGVSSWTNLNITSCTESIFGFIPDTAAGGGAGFLTYTRTVSGSLTATDSEQNTSTRQFVATLTDRSNGTNGSVVDQIISIIATEQ